MNENIVILTILKENISEFIENFRINFLEYSEKNIIVNLLEISDLDKKTLKQFADISKIHSKENKKSLVIVNEQVTYDIVPSGLNFTPTLQEAYDLIEMEEMQRDLGF